VAPLAGVDTAGSLLARASDADAVAQYLCDRDVVMTMADSADAPTTESGPSGADDGDGSEETESLAELATAVVWDGVIGAIAGAGGNAVILGTVFLASLVGGFDLASFGTVADLLGFGAVLSGDQLLLAGLAVFLLGGVVTLPLLLVTIGSFLPGRDYATKGLSFGAILWTGFVLAYYPGYSGLSFALYVVSTFVGHLGYGYVTGTLLDRLFAEEGRPVVAASITAPTARTHDPSNRDTTLVDDERGN